jgi:large subunit ribosomal protein L31
VKEGIHPKYYPEAKVVCACGNTWTTGSTQEEIHTEMCSVCHPFFTGEQRIVDTAGQVDRFQRRKDRSDKLSEEKTRRRLTKPGGIETLFEFATEEKAERPTVQETLQAEFPEVAQQVAQAEAQKQAAAQAQKPAAAEVPAPAAVEKPRRSARPPRRPRSEGGAARPASRRKPKEAAGEKPAKDAK